MTGRLVGIAHGENGKDAITLELDKRYQDEYDTLHEHLLDIDIRKHRNKRSLSANAYAWILIDKIAEAASTDKPTVYRNAVRSIPGVSEVVCVRNEALEAFRRAWEHNGMGWQTETMPSKLKGCTNVTVYYGSSAYNSRQMCALIDYLAAEARELGIETMSEEELNALYQSGPS